MRDNYIELEDFFKNPDQTAFSISPSGTHLAYLSPYENRQNIHVRNINKGNIERLTDVTDRDLSGFFWVSDDQIVYTRDYDGDENFSLFSANIHTKEVINLTPFEGVRVQVIDTLYNDDDHILISMNKRVAQIFDPYKLNIKTGDLQMVAENPGNISSWITDHEGAVRAAVSTDGVNHNLLYREEAVGDFMSVVSTSFKDTLHPAFFDFENKHLAYAISNLGRDKMALVKIDMRSGEELEVVYQHPDVDVSNISYSKLRKVLTTVSFVTWKKDFHFIDETVKTLYLDIQSKLTDCEVVITSCDKKEQVFLVRTYSDRSLGAYYIYRAATSELEKLVEVGPWFEGYDLAQMKPISYLSRDGMTIHGYLTLPVSYEKGKKMPLIVNPHGGPWARDTWTFNPEIQFFANRGYAVLQMNFRGSTGYGRQFWEASFKQWGLAMQDDVTDGVNWLVEQGVVDPKRIAIYGGSYGGYCTLAGVAFTPDLYCCAVDYVGVSNLFTFMETIPPYWEIYLKMLYEMVGDPNDEEDHKRMKATSPVFHVDKIKAPLFIAQGAKDPRVNQDESDQMVEALQKRGVAVQYMLKENEGHGFHNEENRFEFYRAMEEFLSKYMM